MKLFHSTRPTSRAISGTAVFFATSFVLAALIALPLSTAQIASPPKCLFLPTDQAAPIEFALPLSALSHPLKDLPIEFHGISPIVTRKNLKYGESPKVTIQRYSSKPEIYYNELTSSVVISTSGCSSGENDGSSAAAAPPASRSSGSIWVPTLVAAAMAGVAHPQVRPLGWVLAAAVVTSWNQQNQAMLLLGADAQVLDACMPVVQVVVQAPSAYQGAVETCYEEIADPAICPEPFPIFPICDDPAPSCKVVVVGGGAGGLYAALRMVDENKVEGSDICVFEMTERVGGRLFSLRGLGPDEDLSVDAGGYRTWPQFTPTLHALITEYLNIPMDCYDDSDPCIVFNIVNKEGKKAGFATFVETMMQQLSDAGACFYPYHELTSVTKVGDNTELGFANGVTATATMTTILNLPQRPLLNVVRNSGFDDSKMIDTSTLDALHSVQTVVATKFYLYYPKGSVFWRKLGIVSGDFESDGNARSMLLAGRYHDGHVECDDEEDPNTCHGFLLAVYANDLSGNKAQFFRRYQRTRPEPVTFIANTDLEGAELLAHAHQRLVDHHLYEKTDAPYTGFEANKVFETIEPPTFGVLSTWNVAIPWAGGAWHAWTETDNIPKAQQPFVDHNIFVINEAYSLLQGWAEGSIKLADAILEEFFDIPRPWSFPVVDLNQIVQQTNSRECSAAGTTEAAPAGDEGGGSGGDDANAALLCFTGGALVEMADGSFQKLKDVRAGDYVSTGTETGAGLVTEALVHAVGKEVPVAIIETAYGKLTGTPDHPILVDGTWVEIADSDSLTISIEEMFVEAFYNLEVDGDVDENGSSHSYVVNGVIASGLGDNEDLNKRFPRQKVWKERATAANIA